MPYYISDQQSDCSNWATVMQESDGSYTTIGCHDNKQDAIDQMVAVSISEDMEPGGEVGQRTTVGDDRSKMKKIERRTYTVRNVETRKEDDGKMRLSGYAAVFNNASVPLPFIEYIAPGAFRKTLSETPDVRLLINHEGLPLARTKNGTLTLTEDEVGLRFDAELPDTNEARDLYTLIERGDVDQMSFAFRVIRQKFNKDRSERTLTEVSLSDGDVSVVTYPAYPTTTVEAREHLARAIQAVKEGREISGESLVVLQSVFEKMSEGHDYVMEAVEMMAALVGAQEEPVEDEAAVHEDEDELEDIMETEAATPRSISLRLAKAIVNSTK
jgi:HK97 family phage prohead protease